MIIQSVEVRDSVFIIRTDLPQGHLMSELTDQFKQELADLIQRDRRMVGKTVLFSGRMGLAMGFTAGFLLRNARVVNLDVELPQEQQTYRSAGVDDPRSPMRLEYQPGMIVKAVVFGNLVECQIVSVGLGDRLQVELGRDRAWIDGRAVARFVRYAAQGEKV